MSTHRTQASIRERSQITAGEGPEELMEEERKIFVLIRRGVRIFLIPREGTKFFSRSIEIFLCSNNIYGEVLTEGQAQDKSFFFAFSLIQWPNQLCLYIVFWYL